MNNEIEMSDDGAWAGYVTAGHDQIHASMRHKPEYGPRAVRTLADMSPNEIKQIEKRYGAKISKRAGRKRVL